MAASAKLYKSFQDYFRIPILLKGIGNTTQQTLNQIASIFNQIDRFPITDDYISKGSQQFGVSKDKIKKNPQFYQKIKNEMMKRNNYQSHKLLFLSQDFDNDWPELQIVYRVNFVILVFSGEEGEKQEQQGIYRKSSDPRVSSGNELNEKISKMNVRLREKDMELLGIIFLNDSEEYSKSLNGGIRFTLIPGSLPWEQLAMFIEPWVMDLIPLIERNFLQHILDCRWEENSIIVFNRSEEKSEPKIMKKKKKFRCLKICGDLGLMLHLYRFAYEMYNEADDQLRKVDDWMWSLGCIQGKLACMTCPSQLHIKQQDMAKQIQQLIEQSMVVSKRIKQQSFEVENTFKILKLLLHEDKERFDDMIENTLATSKGLTEEDKFLYYSYIGSLYDKAKMERKRNYFYYKAALIIEKFKPQVAQLLLKTIKQSSYIQEWEELNSKLIHKIIQNQSYFNPDAEYHLELLQKCTSVLNPQEIQNIHDYLNYGSFQQKIINPDQQKLFILKEFSIAQSPIKPKPNRLIVDQSPVKKHNTSGVFVGWKKKLTFLYEENQPIQFKGTIFSNLPFQIKVNVFIDLINFPQKGPQFSLIIPPSIPHKFTKEISFSHCDQPIIIKKIRFQMWNFVLYKNIEPQICFELYDKQPQFELEVEDVVAVPQEKNIFKLEMEVSSNLSLRCILKRMNQIECERLRVTCSIYYDIDVGFQQNQFIFSIYNNFNSITMLPDSTQPNIKFLETQEKESSLFFNQNQNILVMKLKKFKATRDHLKKVEINLDYIKQKGSKYQFNKQYVIQPKMVNSVWAQVVEISTPELQQSLKNMKGHLQPEIQLFKNNWNVIQDSFLVKIRFLKDKFNLKPFKVWYDLENQNSYGKVLGLNEAILSNLTQGEMWIKLDKIRICSKQKQQILSKCQQEDSHQNKELKRTLKFRWQNIVNKNMEGIINLQIPRNSFMFTPNLDFQIQIQKQEQEKISNCKTYKLTYTIKSRYGEEIRPHRVVIKAQSQSQLGPQIFQANEVNQHQIKVNECTGTNNASILVKGKTKVNKIPSKRLHQFQTNLNNQETNKNKDFYNEFSNTLTLKVIKEKFHESAYDERDFKMSIVVSIQFDEEQVGKWQHFVDLN